MHSSMIFTENTINIDPSIKVLKSKDYQRFLDVQELIKLSEDKAKKILDDAQNVYESQKEKGYNEGVAQSKLEQADQMLNVVGRTINYLADIEASLANILMSGMEKLIGKYDQGELALRLVRRALDHVRNEKKIVIKVPISQYKLVQENIENILLEYRGVNFVDIIADNSLSTGDCIMESEIGVVDVSVDVQMRALKKRFDHLHHVTISNISGRHF